MANEHNQYNESRVQVNRAPNIEADFMEETATEVAEPIRFGEKRQYEVEEGNGRGIGWLALALSVVSLFIMPVLMGAAGIIFGFIARRRGAETLGAWAIGIGAVSIILSFFFRFW
jgi:hypothetical protein